MAVYHGLADVVAVLYATNSRTTRNRFGNPRYEHHAPYGYFSPGARAAMAFNRLVDRHIDAANPRTAGRHLPAGTLGVGTVWVFTVACCVGFVASTLLFYAREPSNPWPLYLSVPVLLFVLGYSLAKRFTSLAHFWLGAALMLAPVAAWGAIRGFEEPVVPLLLGGAVAFWVAGFDILYACQDARFDRDAGLHSVPARFGIVQSLRIAAACHAVMDPLGFALEKAAGDLAGGVGFFDVVNRQRKEILTSLGRL